MKRNVILNLLVTVIVVCSGLAVYFVLRTGLKTEKWTEESQKILSQENTEQTKSNEIQGKAGGTISPLNKEEIKKIEEQPLTREEIMTFLASQISDLVKKIDPERYPSCDSVQITSFGFTSDRDVYVEYKCDEEKGRILVQATGNPQNIKIEIMALFEPGADMWNLVKGEDTQFGKKIEFYKPDEQGNWISIHQY